MPKPSIYSMVAILPLLLSHSAAADTHPNLSGFWEPRAGSMKSIDRPDFTDEGQSIVRQPNKDSDPNGVDDSSIYCMPVQPPWNLFQSAPIAIVQDQRETNMVYEQRTVPFHIYTDGRGHPQMTPEKLSINGHWIGRWEGNTFVADGLGYAAHPGHHPIFFVPVGPGLHATLRFQLAADGQELHAHTVIEDARYLRKPYVYDFTWYRSKEGEYSRPEVCDPRNPANSHY